MIYKLFNEEGEYVDNITEEPRNLLEATLVYTPEGINVGWVELDNINVAMNYFNIRKIIETKEESKF